MAYYLITGEDVLIGPFVGHLEAQQWAEAHALDDYDMEQDEVLAD
jgi:hypothetical protein